MGSIWLHDLDDVLRAAGLNVRTWSGWENRSRSSGGYDGFYGIVVHHTASKTNPDNDCGYMWQNADDRPIGAVLLERDGRVTIGCAGATNTAGKGGPWTTSKGTVPLDKGNAYTFNIEAANNGTGEQWPQAQQDAYILLCKAMCDRHGFDPDRDIYAHFEWAPGRKYDPAGPSAWGGSGQDLWEMDGFRGDVSSGTTTPPKPPTTKTVFGPDISKWQEGLVPPEPPGIAFGECRASKGTLQDPTVDKAIAYCKERGIPFVAYHFVYPVGGHKAADQAAAFHESVGKDKTINCMLDWEEDSDDECHPPGQPQHPQWSDVLAVRDAIKALGHKVTLVYTGRWYWDKTGKPDMSGAGLALINSNYGPKQTGDAATVYASTGGDDSPGWDPFGGLTPTLLQFSDRVTWGNKQLDMNAFKGDPAELGTWFTTWGAAPPTTTPPTTGEGKDMAAIMPTIKKGSSGPYVERMQHLLASAGFMDAGNTSNYDGVWGNGTDGAKAKFDSAHGLGSGDTSCGAKSWESLLTGKKW